MWRLFIIGVAFFAACKIAFGADVAPAGPTPVIFPWGEIIVAVMNSVVVPFLVALIAFAAPIILAKLVRLFPWLEGRLTANAVERTLTNALDYGVNAVAGAAKGQKLDVATGKAVIDVALRYALDPANVKPAIVAAAGGASGLAAKMFRKMDLEPDASVSQVLKPALDKAVMAIIDAPKAK